MEGEQKQILIIGGSAARRSELRVLLRDVGYSVGLATNRYEGFRMATDYAFDLILIDSIQHADNHLIVCRDIREAGTATPILVLMDRIELADKLLAIKLGADDYVTKPFETAELLMRIDVLLERVRFRSVGNGHMTPIKVDFRRTRVTRDGEPVSMTSREFRLIRYLIERSGKCVSRGELLQVVWGYASNSTTRTIDVHIASLRKKLEANPKFPELIRTIPKVGYMFVRYGGVNQKRRSPLNSHSSAHRPRG